MAWIKKMKRKDIRTLMTIIDFSAIAAFIWVAYKFIDPIVSLLNSIIFLIQEVPIREANPEYKLILILISLFGTLWIASWVLKIICKVADQLKEFCEREMKNMKPEQKFKGKK